MAWDDVEIVSIDQVKAHLRITTDDEDDDLLLKIRQAHALVLDYVTDGRSDDYVTEVEAWDDSTAPAAIQAAILRQVGDLYRFRGDDDDPGKTDDGLDLSPRVKQLLRLYRTPVIA